MNKIFLFEFCIQCIKISLCLFILNKIGVLYGIFSIYLTLVTYHYFMWKLLGLTYLSFDKSLIGFSSRDQYSINLCVCFDDSQNFNQNLFKDRIINQLINKIPKLHSKIVYKFLNFYWQVVHPSEAYKKIKFIDLKDKLDLEKFLKSSVNVRLETFNKIPYEIYIIKYTSTKGGALYLKFDHIMSDGLGFLSLLCLLADDFNLDVFPKILHIKHSYNFLVELKDTLLFPLGILFAVYTIISTSNDKTDYKIMYHPKHFGETKYAISNWFDVSQMKKLRQKYKVSFNDCAVGVFLKSQKILLPKTTALNIVIPCGYTKLPTKPEEIELKLLAQGFMMKLPLISDFSLLNKVHKIISFNIFHTTITSIPLFLFRLFSEFLPVTIVNQIGNYIIFKTDLLISNVPGPDREVSVCGYRMTDFYPIVSAGRMKAFVTVASYNKKFRYIISFDKSVSYDPKETVGTIENIMNDISNNIF